MGVHMKLGLLGGRVGLGCHERLLGKKLCGPYSHVEIYSHPEDHYC